MDKRSVKSVKLTKEEERKKAEAHLKELTIRYSLPTFMGNWLENTFLKNEKDEILEMQKAAGDTIPQKQEFVTSYLQQPLSLSNYYNFIPFGAPIQIVKPNMEFSMSPKHMDCPSAVLSTIITDKQLKIHNIQEIENTCPVIISFDSSPKRTNVFSFVNSYAQNQGNAILYGQEILICLYSSLNTTPLYLRCENPTHDSFGVNDNYLPVVLSSVADRFCKFKFEKSVPDNQIKFFPTDPIPFDDIFFITHVCSNRPLVIGNNIITNYMGGKEKAVACKQDIYRENNGEKYWKLMFKEDQTNK